jgi:hypothetical protein
MLITLNSRFKFSGMSKSNNQTNFITWIFEDHLLKHPDLFYVTAESNSVDALVDILINENLYNMAFTIVLKFRKESGMKRCIEVFWFLWLNFCLICFSCSALWLFINLTLITVSIFWFYCRELERVFSAIAQQCCPCRTGKSGCVLRFLFLAEFWNFFCLFFIHGHFGASCNNFYMFINDISWSQEKFDWQWTAIASTFIWGWCMGCQQQQYSYFPSAARNLPLGNPWTLFGMCLLGFFCLFCVH